MAWRRGARAGQGQLAPVDVVEVDRRGRGEDEHAPARRNRLERGGGTAEDDGVDRAVRRAAGAVRPGVDREDLVAAPLEHGREEPSDEAVPDDEDSALATRSAPRSTQASGSTYVPSASSIPSGSGRRSPPPPAPRSRRNDRRRREALARRLVAGAAALALAARHVVDQRDARAVRALRDDLDARARCPPVASASFSRPSRKGHASTRMALGGAAISASPG